MIELSDEALRQLARALLFKLFPRIRIGEVEETVSRLAYEFCSIRDAARKECILPKPIQGLSPADWKRIAEDADVAEQDAESVRNELRERKAAG